MVLDGLDHHGFMSFTRAQTYSKKLNGKIILAKSKVCGPRQQLRRRSRNAAIDNAAAIYTAGPQLDCGTARRVNRKIEKIYYTLRNLRANLRAAIEEECRSRRVSFLFYCGRRSKRGAAAAACHKH